MNSGLVQVLEDLGLVPRFFLLLCIDMSGVALQGLLKGGDSCLCISEALDLCPLLSGLKGGDSVFPRAVARRQ